MGESFRWDTENVPVEPERTIEHVEADIRKAMAEHAAILPRGWQTMQQRNILHRRIDGWLDEYALMADVAEVTA